MTVGEAFINGRHRFMGDGLSNPTSEGAGAALQLGGFQQMAAGFMEDHATKFVGEHHGVGAGIDVIGVEHRSGAGGDVAGGAIGIPDQQIVGMVGAAKPTSDAGAVLAIGSQHTQAQGLVQA